MGETLLSVSLCNSDFHINKQAISNDSVLFI